MTRTLSPVFIVLVLLATPLLAQPDMTGSAVELGVQTFDDAWRLIDATMEVVLDDSLSPATAQEMIRSATAAIYRSCDQSFHRNDLAQQLSSISGRAELRSEFADHWERCQSAPTFQPNVATYAALNGLLSRAAPGGRFVSAKEYRVQQQLRENQYVGIGIQVREVNGRTLIDLPFIGGPAFRAGARAGDKIMQIDGQPTEGMSLYDVVQTLRGPKDSAVTIVVQNVDGSPPRELAMTRHVVPLPTVKGTHQYPDESWDVLLPDQPDVAYLKIASIVGSTAAEFRSLMQQVKKTDARQIVIDIRDLPAGELHHAVMLCDMILPETELARVHLADRVEVLRTRPETVLDEDRPIRLLVSPRVPGPVGLVVAAFRSRSNVQIDAAQVVSDGICFRATELLDQLGAIENMPYAWCEPLTGNRRMMKGGPDSMPLGGNASPLDFPLWVIPGDKSEQGEEISSGRPYQ